MRWVIFAAYICVALLDSCRSDDGVVSPASSPEPRPPSPIVSPSAISSFTGTPDVVPRLQDTRWQLVSLDGERIADDTVVTLAIGGEGSTGELVCNSHVLFATFANGGTIIPETGPAGERWVSTTQSCRTSTLSFEEYNEFADRYLTTLTDATSYEVEDDTLRLSTPDGRVLVYQRT